MRFQDKICLVTGGGSGIGKAAAQRLAAEGGTVFILNRNEEEGQAAVREITDAGGQAGFIETDVSKPEEIERAVQSVLDRHGRIDVLVHSAAMMTFKPVLELSLDEWDQVQATNLRSAFWLSRLCLPHMRGGAIVHVSSVHAHQTTANVSPYAASKGGLEAFTAALSRELDRAQTRVNCVAPGAVDTPMLWENPNVKSGKEQVDKKEVGQPEDIAAAICFLASDEARFITGTTLVVDGGRLEML
jgi:NAD(P)-dependent dehydrogenase (short-subunit alcohol dehydrogenase family)